jgi:pSer/pThr/pTyr-binding forkhead associated (FHA) protein
MIQLNVLLGRKAGSQMVVRHFPFRIGRAGGNDLQLDDDGIWDDHLRLEIHRNEGFMLAAAPNALVAINNQPVQSVQLHNGDIITAGSVKIQFWLAAASQRRLLFREFSVWALIAIITALQIALIYMLTH